MKNLLRYLRSVVAALMLASLSSLAASGARAELRPIFDQLKLYNSPATLPTIEVEAEGQEWTKVSTQSLHLTTSYYVSLEKGGIIAITGIYDYSPAITRNCHPGGGRRRWGEFSFEIPNSQMGLLTHKAIFACNQKKESGARTDGTHTAYIAVPFKLCVRAERVGNQSTKNVDGDVQAKVVCKQAPKEVDAQADRRRLDALKRAQRRKHKHRAAKVSFSEQGPSLLDCERHAHCSKGCSSCAGDQAFVHPAWTRGG